MLSGHFAHLGTCNGSVRETGKECEECELLFADIAGFFSLLSLSLLSFYKNYF